MPEKDSAVYVNATDYLERRCNFDVSLAISPAGLTRWRLQVKEIPCMRTWCLREPKIFAVLDMW